MINTSTVTHGSRCFYAPLRIVVEMKYCLACPLHERVSNAMQNPQDYFPEYDRPEQKDPHAK